MRFNYQARTKTGKIQMGVVKASDKEAAFKVLKSYGLYVTALQEAAVPVYAQRLKIFERISKKNVVILSRQLAIMFKSEIPLVESLRTLAKQAPNSNLKETFLKIAEEVEGGASLSSALSLYPKVFSPFYVNMVKSGEASGKLTDIFLYLADYLEKENYFREKIIGALVYPAFIVIVFTVIVGLIITFVIPQLSDFLKSTEQELPFITKAVIAISDFLRKRGILLLVGLAGLAAAFYALVKTKIGKDIKDKIILKMPLLGVFLKKFYLSRFALNLSTLVSGGLPIARALEITGQVVGNNVYKAVILKTKDEVKKGEKISFTLKKYPDIIAPIFYQMVVVGEKTGTLDKTLVNIVDFYQKDIDRSADTFIKLLEPLLIIILGILVGGLVVSVLLPIYGGIGNM